MDPDPSGRLTARQLAHLVESGRLSPAEAARLRDGDEATRQESLGGIRSRHIRERLAPAVELGLISEEEAAALVARVGNGQHDPQLRRRINDLARQASQARDGSS